MLDEHRWNNLISKIAVTPIMNRFFDEIVSAYTEPHRRYHGAGHIAQCLMEFDSAMALARCPVQLEFAIWFHDVVYVPESGDNELKSAQLAKQILVSLGASSVFRDRVFGLIMATRHKDIPHDSDARLLMDIDLSGLAQTPQQFDAHENAIRAEYAWAPDASYRLERRRVLQRFLDRPRIYQTRAFFDLYEQRARANIVRAIKRL